MAGLDINAREVVLLTESYSEVKSCLYIIRQAREQEIPVKLFIFGNPDLHRFFNQLNETIFENKISIQYYDVFPSAQPHGGLLKRIGYYLKDTCRRKAYYRRISHRHFAALSGAAVFFFTRYMSPYNYYFLNRLSGKNEITYICTLDYPDLVEKYHPGNILELLSLWKLKVTYGHGITYARFPHAKFEYLPDKFIAGKTDHTFSLEATDNLLKDFNFEEFRVFDSRQFQVLYFDQPLITSGRIADTAVFRRELDAIFTILNKHFSDDKIGLKYHPVSHTDKSFIKTGVILDDSLPAETLYHPNIKLYLSFCSSALANVEKGLTVSLLDLITFEDETAKGFIRETLIRRSRSAILFPQTLAELERIIAGAAGDNSEK
jgi:hypothetical protein